MLGRDPWSTSAVPGMPSQPLEEHTGRVHIAMERHGLLVNSRRSTTAKGYSESPREIRPLLPERAVPGPRPHAKLPAQGTHLQQLSATSTILPRAAFLLSVCLSVSLSCHRREPGKGSHTQGP